ncbi:MULTISPECIES: hypothetical protein [Sphingomonas]|uniref:Uncharacterized protein n=1 Tax=Sphingomonas arantia TaxID=1460676 RepID=A0ABW4U078_9SPHN|nr:hypothetical protein [Sphingomonas prati]
MRTKLWVGVGAFVIAQTGPVMATEAAAATPFAATADQPGEGGENERGEGEGEGEGRRRATPPPRARHIVKHPRRARAVQQQRGQRGEGEAEGGENERGEGER